jgi:hypothetical protein
MSFWTCATPTGDFKYLGHEILPKGSSMDYYRDLAAFKDTEARPV